MWFETHAHLADPKFDADRTETVARAFEAGVEYILEIADGPSEWDKARQLAEQHPGRLWWAAGVHPYFAETPWAEAEKSFRAFTSHPQFAAIGEIGLDYAKCPVPRELQKSVFIQAIELSLELDKPMIIHCRDAYADLVEILSKFSHRLLTNKNGPGVIHCFSGNKDEALALLKMGFFLGVDGPVTYPKANTLREALAACPLDRLVVETDSPYLPPQSRRGTRNEPAFLPEIAIRLAQLHQLTPEKAAPILMANSRRLFRLNHAE